MKYRNPKNAEATARYWGKSLERSDWFSVKGLEDGDQDGDQDGETLEVFIYDIIGWPFNEVEDLVKIFAAHPDKPIHARLNTPGGDVFDGLALYNSLQKHRGRVVTTVEGLAASMGSVVAMAGDEVQAHKNAMLMIHEPWVFTAGNQHDLREIADILQKMSGNLLDAYHDKTGRDKRKLKQEMEDETWFTATEAKDRGLVDTVLEKSAEKAAFDLSMFAHAPEGFAPEGRELSEREMERALRDAGASQSFARQVVHSHTQPRREAGVSAASEEVQRIIHLLEE